MTCLKGLYIADSGQLSWKHRKEMKKPVDHDEDDNCLKLGD